MPCSVVFRYSSIIQTLHWPQLTNCPGLGPRLRHHRGRYRNLRHPHLRRRLLPVLLQTPPHKINVPARQGPLRPLSGPAPAPVRPQHPGLCHDPQVACLCDCHCRSNLCRGGRLFCCRERPRQRPLLSNPVCLAALADPPACCFPPAGASYAYAAAPAPAPADFFLQDCAAYPAGRLIPVSAADVVVSPSGTSNASVSSASRSSALRTRQRAYGCRAWRAHVRCRGDPWRVCSPRD